MLNVMYGLWLFIIFCVSHKALVGKGRTDYEILAPSLAALVLCAGGFRPFIQAVVFAGVYLFMTFLIFAADVYRSRKNQN